MSSSAGLGPHSPGETIERVRLREEVEKEVRAELEPKHSKERLEELNRAQWAWFVARVLWFFLALVLGVPLVFVVLGLSLRAFLFLGGFR